MQVSISKASEMVGVTRATFYRHIDKKGISVTKDEEGNPKIDVSELIRVYGNKVRNLSTDVSNDTHQSNVEQDKDTVKTARVSNYTNAETELLKEKIKHLEETKAQITEERQRERQQYEERVEQLQKTLDKAQENQNKTTALLEHYTKGEGANNNWQESIKTLEEKISKQEIEAKAKAEEEAKQKELLLAEKKDLSKANKVYASLALIVLLGVSCLAIIQSGIIKISF